MVREVGLVVGVDGGGTRTRAVLVAAGGPHALAGEVLGRGEGGPGNPLSVSVPELAEHLATAIGEAVPAGDRSQVVAVGAGFAGAARTLRGDIGRVRALTALDLAARQLGLGGGADGGLGGAGSGSGAAGEADGAMDGTGGGGGPLVEVYSDAEAAFASAPGTPPDGIALIAGTGAVGVRIARRRSVAYADGNGWLLGDEGGAFWIGREAVRAALRAADGRGAPTALQAAVYREAAADGRAELPERPSDYRGQLVPLLMARPPIALARFARVVVAAAEEGDPVAEVILDRAAEHLAETVRALRPVPNELLVGAGSLLGDSGPLTDRLRGRLAAESIALRLRWVEDGTRGAAALATLSLTGR
ncbi:N-acetylglucosamine kinase [Phaeacidiphilus oryzae]|uniref:N-acetylglucosamine kinase n=1 Tax=Phaeacidiphilus oryzae TaxID=348818 RepID=UPI000568D081|nr:BadF/BadG/BcrA/BcrD ATPase family protein [Phaeacidiphilus oryzae]